MSYQINYLASAVKNLQVNKIPALESAINRISKKINVSGVDDLIQNINQLREEYSVLSKDDNLSSFKETYEDLLRKYDLVDGSVKVLDATIGSILSDVSAMKRAYKAITVMRDFTEIENTINSFKENYDNIFMLNENFERLDNIELTFKELNYNELTETREYKESNDYDLIQKNLKQIVDEVYKFTQTGGDVITSKEYEFHSFTDDSTMNSTPINYLKYIRDTCKNIFDEKVDQTEYNEKISNIESNISNKVDQTEYNEKISSLESNISSKVSQAEYNEKISNIESNISNKVDQTEYNEKISDIESSIESKVSQTEYNQKISVIESNVSNKVEQTEYNSKIASIESNISSKVSQSEYNEKISVIESEIDGVKGRVDALENKDCLAEQIDYNPYASVSSEALAATGLSESSRTDLFVSPTRDVIKSNAEISNKVNLEVDYVINPKLSNHETEIDGLKTRVTALETSQPTDPDSGNCLAKNITVAPYSQVTNEALAFNGKDESEKTKTTDMVVETAIKDAYENSLGCAAEIQCVIKPKINSVEERIKAIEDADFEGRLTGFEVLDIETKLPDHESRITALESGESTHTDCLENSLTVKPIGQFSNEAFIELKKNQPEADKSVEVSQTAKQIMKDGYEYAFGAIGELQLVVNPTLSNLKTKIGEFETIELGMVETGTNIDGNLVYTDSSINNYSNVVEAIQGVNANVWKNQAVIERANDRAINLTNEMTTMNTQVNNISTEVNKLIADKNPTDDYHTYHMYHRLFTKAIDFPVVESAIVFEIGNKIGVTKLKLHVYSDSVTTFQITSDMIPNHFKDETTIKCSLILSFNYPGIICNDGIIVSNETGVLLKLENVFIDVADNTNGGANVGDITLQNFTIYKGDGVVVSMYNKPLHYKLNFEHSGSTAVAGIELINIQHNINDEIASRNVTFFDSAHQTEIATSTVTKVVL